MSQVVAIYGPTCSLKSNVARSLSQLTGYKMASRGEAVTTQALMHKQTSGLQVDLEFHRQIDDESRNMLSWPDPVLILESNLMDAVLHGCQGVFLVHLHSSDEARVSRWEHRREEGGGRTRQIGEGVAQRDADDAQLRQQLYPNFSKVEPMMDIDTTEGKVRDYALQIWSKFTGVDLSELEPAERGEMDKRATKGLKPGPSAGEVAVYNAKRNPFGGYIVDDASGRKVFIHKSAVESSGLGELTQGQRVAYQIVEDGFGGFRATNISQE